MSIKKHTSIAHGFLVKEDKINRDKYFQLIDGLTGYDELSIIDSGECESKDIILTSESCSNNVTDHAGAVDIPIQPNYSDTNLTSVKNAYRYLTGKYPTEEDFKPYVINSYW